jgi:hypothetical protein
MLLCLFATTFAAYAQSGYSYYGTSASDDGSTIYGYAVIEGNMLGADCNHTYSVGIAFNTMDYWPNFTTTSHSVPASSYASFRADASVVLDGTSDYWYHTVTSASCDCVGRTFYEEVKTNPLQKTRAYYSCQGAPGPCQISGGVATYRRCNQTPTSICNTIFSKPLNGSTPPPYALKTVYQIYIGSLLTCAGLQTADQTTDKCYSPDPIP